MEEQVRRELVGWYPQHDVASWQHLKTYEIHYALPTQAPPHLSPVEKDPLAPEGYFRCGDYLNTGSTNGALASGRRAGEAVLAALA